MSKKDLFKQYPPYFEGIYNKQVIISINYKDSYNGKLFYYKVFGIASNIEEAENDLFKKVSLLDTIMYLNGTLNKIDRLNHFEKKEISNIDISRARMFDVKTKVSTVEQGKNYTPIMLRTEIYNEKGEMIDNKEYTGYIVKSIITMEQSVDKNKTYVEENEKIEYTYKIRNEGTADAYSKFVFNAPQGARILSESGATKNVTKEFTLQPNETKEIKEEIENKSQNQISDIQNNKKNTDSISQNILDNTSKKSDNTDQEIGEIGNFNTEENNYYNDDIYYDVDSESLINVFDNLDSASKTENNNENNKK